MGKTLVAYFSASGVTKKLAQHMAQASGETAKDSKYRDLADQLN